MYFINIYQRLHQMQNVICYSLCFSLTFFIAFLSFLFPCFCSLFLSNLFRTHRKNVGKASYQTFNILLFLTKTIGAIFLHTLSGSVYPFVILWRFIFFKILFFFGDVRFHSLNGIILLLQHILYLRSVFPSPVLNCEPLSNTLLAWFCRGDKRLK